MNQEIDFEKMRGLAPAIVQDAAGGDVLMLGFMNQAALARTLATGYVTFFSRTRNLLWTKGETSGNRLRVITASTDCDHDSQPTPHAVRHFCGRTRSVARPPTSRGRSRFCCARGPKLCPYRRAGA